ncbi:hypothetical protein HSBAA_54720 [Vreelandella sulfidaeris]|uniref:Uncharacterized protein n=1 Tax=Vreelandella sulfidaeris TaxID=115553 RepID=A0A455UD60_9GAMM|nr:hypothetical protein HSBAA_54720 [Halomonas sulfidaeris]
MGCNSEPPVASRECTLSLVRSGYPYISAQCDRLGTNLFSRLRLKKTLFMRGEEAAELFTTTSFSRVRMLHPNV